MESSNPDRKQVRVTIFNQTYSVLTTGEEAQMQELAQTVDELMSGIAARSGNLDTAGIAVLACLHLADRLRSLEQDLAELRQRVDKKSKDFSLLLDQVVDPK
jgi:cell division protein ZapA